MLREWGSMLTRKERGDATMSFTSLLSAIWLLLLGCAVTSASSQPDDPVISPKLIADVLLEVPPAVGDEYSFS